MFPKVPIHTGFVCHTAEGRSLKGVRRETKVRALAALLVLALVACASTPALAPVSSAEPTSGSGRSTVPPMADPPRGGCTFIDGTTRCALTGDPARDTLMLSQFVGQLLAHHAYTEALPVAMDTVALTRAVYGSEHRNLAADLLKLGEIYRATGDFFNAEGAIDEAIAIDTKLYGTQHPEVAIDLLARARLEEAIDKPRAVATYTKALATLRASEERSHRDQLAWGLQMFGSFLTGEHANAEAYKRFKEAHEVLASIDPEAAASLCAHLVGLAQQVGDRQGTEHWIACAHASGEQALCGR